ncbi:nuclear transport factor 2 family protein [Rhodococcus sp. 5G237]
MGAELSRSGSGVDWNAHCDREAIRNVLALYCRAVDRGDRELLLSLYHPDAIDDHGSFVGTVVEFAEFAMQKMEETFDSVSHVLGSTQIELEGDVAMTETYYTGMHVLKAGPGQPRRLMTSVGRYIDRFERRDGDWRIARRVVVKTFRDLREMNEPVGDRFVLARRDRLDPVYAGPLGTAGLERG